ncbi:MULTISPECIES: LysR family transcriptional regulator [unclassified Undibacterium]|uniref:LysR family transcriptional regulator n=1 Tax=unclassified Undibacterium TaxID=2630295 RepID=UPI002AC932E6|nr:MULTISPECIES: LysR substrate-binding domain-containing protein [unclassified Undibacterium]MEB0139691.1 LysR substrate-binding domain-containing protein [Undibacterium sp. CCC2.1]MEB0172572.1 LysR substrate-binding domain-containing protein [Undibacterium sp. CCC1.1]MEB0176332.1 LysR substrate-binding domain-containing protein [Undibacterium sp. CCC3.4]MEB0215666.1 LysR substrate-binding domain-containing protein [Undibacterium sp. 5I2]WPX42944.1 LysR substrate-binding domain-containing pro
MNETIDLRQLRYFLAVSEERHFGRAAARLHISQPPLSRQIRQLENQLGVELFVRQPTGVCLTQAGTAFLPEVRRTLAQLEKAVAAARAERGTDAGQFVVGYTTVFDHSAIPDVLDRLRERFPNCHIVSSGKHSIRLVRDLKNASMDVAFIGLHTNTQDLKVEIIFDDPLVLALPATHRLAKLRKIDYHELRGEPMFWFERRLNPGFYDYCQAFFDQIDFQPHVIPEPDYHHILLGLIAEGQGVALIPASLRKVKYQGVVFREMKEQHKKLSMGIAVAYLESNQSPMLRAFLDLLKQKYLPA